MTKKEYLYELLNKIAVNTGTFTDKEKAKENNSEYYLYINHNPVYGGYLLANVKIDTGAYYDAFGFNSMTRHKYKEFELMLWSFLKGLKFKQDEIHS